MGIPVSIIPPAAECMYWPDPPNTPGKIYSVFWDVQKGDRGGALQPPNLRVFSCYQVGADACIFNHDVDPPPFCSEFGTQLNACWLYLYTGEWPRRYYFSHQLPISPIDEYQMFTNFAQTPVNNYGWGGFGTIFWLDKVVAIAGEMGWSHLSDLMHEVIPIDAAKVILKFCSKSLGVNVQLKVDI